MISAKSWPDNLRIIATLSMVLLHTVSPILYKFGKVSSLTWHTSNIADSAVRFCVPVFVMLSGALLLGKEYSIKDFLKKRIVRVLLPFLFWSIVYIVYDLVKRPLPEISKAAEFVWNRAAHGASYHLWYIYMIIGLYLFIPIIGRWIRACTDKEIKYFLFLWIGTMAVSHPVLLQYKPNFDLSYFSGFLGYLILGYYLSRKRNSLKWKTAYSLLILLAGISITAIGTYYSSLNKGKFDSLFYGFLTPNVLLTSSAVFMLIGNFAFNFTPLEKIRIFLCKYSFGIYLIHVLVLKELNKAGLNCFTINPFAGIVLTTLACVIISGLVVWLINKLPFGKYVSG